MTIKKLPPFDLKAGYEWMEPETAMGGEFAEDQYWLDDAKGPIAASSLLTTTRSSDIVLPDSAGVFQTLGNDTLPSTDRGLYVNGQRTNKNVNYNANPTDLSGIAKGGDPAATLTIVDDVSALAAAGLQHICTSGKAFKIDNSAGTNFVVVTLAGDAANTNPHTFSAFVRVSGTAYFRDSNGPNFKPLPPSAGYVRQGGTFTPQSTASRAQFYLHAGAIVYFILNQFEEAPFAGPPIVVSGSAATLMASDIHAVQGIRPSNSEPEPFAGWEDAGLDNAFGINASMNIDRLNAASARTIAAVGIDANQLYHVYLDTDDRVKARLRKLGPELRGNGAIGLVGTATAATYNTGTGEAVASRVTDANNQSFVQWSGLTTNGTYLVDVENTGATGMGVRSGHHSASAVAVAAGQRQTVLATAANGGRITLCAQSNNTTANFTVHSIREVVTHYTLQSGVISTLGDYDIAAVLNPGSNSLTVSGGIAGDTNASVETLPAGSTTLRVGSDFGALNPFNGWIKNVQVVKVE